MRTKIDKENKKTSERDFKKFTRKKSFSEHIAYRLYYDNPESRLKKSYKGSILCASTLFPNKDNTKLISFYCKQRWCPLCQSIRVAKMISGYAPALNELKEPYFVTLTAKTVGEELLDDRIQKVKDFWKYISSDRIWKKRKPKGIRKTECTIRPNEEYHYHQHIIIDGKDNAILLHDLWMRYMSKSKSEYDTVKENAQDVRPVRKGEYIELFKYFTKIVAYDKTAKKRFIDFKRLNVIFEHIRGSRVYQPFGGIKAVSEDIEEYQLLTQEVQEEYLKIWKWATDVGYFDEDTGEILTGDYKIPEWVNNVCGNIDKEKINE